MNQKDILALGVITAFVFAAVFTIKPADAQDEDYVAQTGIPPNINTDVNIDTEIQIAVNTAIVAGLGDDNTATAKSGQTTDFTEGNDPSDKDFSDDGTDSFNAPSVWSNRN
jgi:hypothetical protein